jgi:hypothetical protein
VAFFGLSTQQSLNHLPCITGCPQGTTCVFSKKVEHLHNLVYQALDTIINKKQKEKAAAARKGDKAGRATEADLDDADTFFDLEATIEQADDIDLAEEEEPGGVQGGFAKEGLMLEVP